MTTSDEARAREVLLENMLAKPWAGGPDDQFWATARVTPHEAIAAMLAFASSSTPEGDRVMVPREPTEAMYLAGCEYQHRTPNEIWSAMLTAAPSQPDVIAEGATDNGIPAPSDAQRAIMASAYMQSSAQPGGGEENWSDPNIRHLADLLQREGLHSGVWFKDHLVRAAGLLRVAASSKAVDGQETFAHAADFLDQYASFIRDDVKADDLERHPYLPAVEGVVADLRALATPAPSEQGEVINKPIRLILRALVTRMATACDWTRAGKDHVKVRTADWHVLMEIWEKARAALATTPSAEG